MTRSICEPQHRPAAATVPQAIALAYDNATFLYWTTKTIVRMGRPINVN